MIVCDKCQTRGVPTSIVSLMIGATPAIVNGKGRGNGRSRELGRKMWHICADCRDDVMESFSATTLDGLPDADVIFARPRADDRAEGAGSEQTTAEPDESGAEATAEPQATAEPARGRAGRHRPVPATTADDL